MDTLVVNLYAGPGAGKSTAAAYLFAKVKMLGINAEYVTEYAKDITWEHAMSKLNCQFYISGKQAYKMARVYGKVNVIITDSPLALGAVYTDDANLRALCMSEMKKYDWNSINIFLNRLDDTYKTEGRNQTYDEALGLDQKIKAMLTYHDYKYISIKPTPEELDKVVETICQKIGMVKKIAEPEDDGNIADGGAADDKPVPSGW